MLPVRAHGIILKTERFDACVTFYRDALELPLWFEKDALVCLRFGDGYLMIEKGGVAQVAGKDSAANPTVLRLNVDDVQACAAMIRAKGIAVDVQDFDWGTIGVFHDPDGNICELKDAADPFFTVAQ